MDDEIEEFVAERDYYLALEQAYTNSSRPEIYLHLPASVLRFQRITDGKESGFRRTANACLKRICKAVLHHDWQTAAELMTNYFQTLEDSSPRSQSSACEAIWRLGTTILQHHPNSSTDNVESFVRKIKLVGVNHYLKACLEHAIHLLCSGKMDEAYRELSLAETWRYGAKTAAQQDVLKLIQGYRALLDYYTWAKKNRALHERANDAVDSTTEQEMHKYFRQASFGLRGAVQNAGVWDPFILSYVNLLDFYDGFEEALKVLNDYAYDSRFPPNPNAHVYLYEFLKRHGSPPKKLMKVLRILYHLVPSHELMLEFISLLLKSKRNRHHNEALSVLFCLLDFPTWKGDRSTWKHLHKQVKKAIAQGHSDWIKEQWEPRQDWWPAFHFSKYRALKDFDETENYAYRKATIAGILMGKGCKYFITIYQLGRKVQKVKLKKMRQYVKDHSLLQLSRC
ncbi:TATA box-binding protein-associated factor RNA polymerase I subunit A [Amblyraja radiata]|uniref:TATA box-binding protein-associated factor RNA polymerase I subunit A n=1 Tax=Amblyraja radiata TaxID=386614 RepID=UPI001404170B|nr:TATA box-binding protein-associated factor RNA polymerase I subunit A [Amblyraja radiata]XP_032881174.1 TATA box-binding protein-associated factor RNA polymerase I subunit A [Amblyraja radiata]XP_032881175.1 TATA box-binding protein-associated factor RNA polymerase I subunit A [Amblyraja radiata]XP_032881176.1 TATA box-binding protein-associated factor RNA polymerase I subunit A [Amblyraja radiata]XP_032881177.1 TATA box-binding protein-associated factor RNA polymerase I subunit A [Amblyraja